MIKRGPEIRASFLLLFFLTGMHCAYGMEQPEDYSRAFPREYNFGRGLFYRHMWQYELLDMVKNFSVEDAKNFLKDKDAIGFDVLRRTADCGNLEVLKWCLTQVEKYRNQERVGKTVTTIFKSAVFYKQRSILAYLHESKFTITEDAINNSVRSLIKEYKKNQNLEIIIFFLETWDIQLAILDDFFEKAVELGGVDTYPTLSKDDVNKMFIRQTENIAYGVLKLLLQNEPFKNELAKETLKKSLEMLCDDDVDEKQIIILIKRKLKELEK